MTHRSRFAVLFALVFVAVPIRLCLAQDIAPQRTLEELKEETLKRVQEKPQRSMVEGILVEDAKAALAKLHSLDRDEWAAVWMTFGDQYMRDAKTLESSGNLAAKDMYLRAYAYYKLGHYPTENSPKKKRRTKKGSTRS